VDQSKFTLCFQVSEGNINCISHIYNLAVQARHCAVKVNYKKDKIRYAFEQGSPEFPAAELESTGRLALFQIRSLIHKFRRCREYRDWLVRQCQAAGIKFREL
jgi:hypothetical protein